MFRKYRQSVPPTFLSPSDVERVLAVTGSALSGRRDHAILLLLARLGLRGGEVVALELDDIRWRAGEIVVRGKGQMVDHLPDNRVPWPEQRASRYAKFPRRLPRLARPLTRVRAFREDRVDIAISLFDNLRQFSTARVKTVECSFAPS